MLVHVLNKHTLWPVRPEWAHTLWQEGQDHELIRELDTFNTLPWAYLVLNTDWNEIIDELAQQGRLAF
jgi:hypothetical protein